jgi:diaminopimelate epimerase
VKCRVLERGVGETLACGSGACAVAAAGKKLGKLESEVAVEYRGGTIGVRVEGDGNIFMSGKANFVFQGTIAM